MCSVSMPSSARAAGSSQRQSTAAHNDFAGVEARKGMESTTPAALRQKPSTCLASRVLMFVRLSGKAGKRSRRGRTRNQASNACHGSQRLPEPGRTLRLLARRADVHVDFHADLHFDDLRSFPSHSALPSLCSSVWRNPCADFRVGVTRLARKRRCESRHRRRLSPQQSQQRATGRRVQLLGVQRSVIIAIGRTETLLHDREIFVQR